jgi:4,5-dihydroxyphthalate decarboxylase
MNAHTSVRKVIHLPARVTLDLSKIAWALRLFLAAATFAPIAHAQVPATPAPGRPLNIILVLRDQTRSELPAAAGYHTPALDRLAQQGITFRNHYIASAMCTPSRAALIHPHIGWLFPDTAAVAKDYYKRTGIFPIMHVTGVRRTLVEQHPWLPAAVLKAFELAKARCLEELEDTATSKCTLPFVDEQLKAARELMGHDFWSYGLAPNRKVLETFLRHHYSEGLSPRLVSPEEMFHPATHESFTI